MSITHHPSDIVLAEFANATLDEAASVVVVAHLLHCQHCRNTVREFETLGGILLEDTAPSTPLSAAAGDLLHGDAGQPTLAAGKATSAAALSGTSTAPDSAEARTASLMSLYAAGRWRWIGPGLHRRELKVPSTSGVRVFMLKAKGGLALPDHTHSGIEWTCVLEGAFSHEAGRFGVGDFDEADASVHHEPIVEEGTDCVCLVAMSGQLKLKSRFGRLLQPFVRI
ncbi:MAG: ChrR family anti-sigma-E factor [Hyphomicrobiaceae bacterium]